MSRCIQLMSEDRLKELYTLKISALLHDIGKPLSWAEERPAEEHVLFSRELIAQHLNKEIADLAMRHHFGKKYPEEWRARRAVEKEWIIHNADILATGADRPEAARNYGKKPLLPVRFSHPFSKGDVMLFPEMGRDELFKVTEQLKVILNDISPLIDEDPEKAYRALFDEIEKSPIMRVPADTRPPKNDHSLWVHMRLAAAFATCVFVDRTYEKGKRLGEYSFGILGGDTDKVGTFIHTSRRLPDLRARSRIARTALEEAVNVIDARVGPESVVYYGGGNFLAIVPTTQASELKELVEKRFLDCTRGKLSITIGCIEAGGWDVYRAFNEVWRNIFGEVRRRKREKIPEETFQIGSGDKICDVCREKRAFPEKRDSRFWLTENGIRRREELCDDCWYLRWESGYAGGPDIDKYADENTGLVAFFKVDGDDIGDFIEGSIFKERYGKRISPARLTFVSQLVDESCNDLQNIVEKPPFNGECIYAGGDDVLALAKGSDGLTCVKKLTDTFREKFVGQAGMSAGVVIIKHNFPIYMAIEAVQELLKNGKGQIGKASVDFETIYQVGLTRKDFEQERREEKRTKSYAHRPCKIDDLRGLADLLEYIDKASIHKSQAKIIVTALLSPTRDNMEKAKMVAFNLIGRGYIDWETGKFLIRSIENGMICDAYSLSTKVYRRE